MAPKYMLLPPLTGCWGEGIVYCRKNDKKAAGLSSYCQYFLSLTLQNECFYGTNHTNRLQLGLEPCPGGDMSAGGLVFHHRHALRAGAAFPRDGTTALLDGQDAKDGHHFVSGFLHTAIGFGGPGAIVWMWIIAFFGAGSAFVEATLAQVFKEDHNGQFRGGPAYYIENGLRSPFFGAFFAVLAALACGVFLPPVQCNGIALSCSRAFGVAPWVIGVVVAVLIALVIIGGVKRIANVAQIVAPVMAVIYILLSIVVLVINYRIVPDVFLQMLRGAVGLNEVGGALIGSTIAWGVKRGIYSNEAGQGTGPIVAAAATGGDMLWSLTVTTAAISALISDGEELITGIHPIIYQQTFQAHLRASHIHIL